MKNADFAVNSRIRVVKPDSEYYRYRGIIVEDVILGEDTHLGWKCHLTKDDSGRACDVTDVFIDTAITNVQKKFIDIEHIREEDVLVGKDSEGNDIIRKGNVGAFAVGDLIQITEKVDGSNASVAWNAEDVKLEVFSRTNLLDGVDGLRGFKQYVETRLNASDFSGHPEYVVFGEWTVSHKVQYAKENWGTWKVYDIWDRTKKNYLPQVEVKAFCAKIGLEYIHVLYEGPFVSWEHCRSFLHSNTYGDSQEGIVVKSQTKLDDQEIRQPKYLKIVNEEFKESMKVREKKPIDPEKQKEFDNAKALISSVVTEARVNKAILKLIDSGELPAELTPKCMGAVMKRVPKMIWDDIVKEEIETVRAAGEDASRICSALTAELARKLVVGK